MKTTAIASWYGSNRMLAENVGKLLKGCKWVGVPFAGGMCELAHIDARTIIVSDLHQHVINLANVLRHPALGPMLIRDLRRLPFHEHQLKHAQEHCIRVETRGFKDDHETAGMESSYIDALNYFVTVWMGRNGVAGTDSEFRTGFSIRWNATGGDSAVRWRSAVDSLRDWRKIMPRCTFVVMHVVKFLGNVKDEEEHGLYLDPPFPGPGDKYKHKFTHQDHVDLAMQLNGFTKCRIVCRFYDHPLIRKLYLVEDGWKWQFLEGRKQTNDAAPEVLLVKR